MADPPHFEAMMREELEMATSGKQSEDQLSSAAIASIGSVDTAKPRPATPPSVKLKPKHKLNMEAGLQVLVI